MEAVMARVAYYRVSTRDQSIEAQRGAMGGDFTREFEDEGVSGAVLARDRQGFSKCLEFLRDGDTLCVYAMDRLGRDSIDVQTTVRALLEKGVTVEVKGIGQIGTTGAGGLLLALLAQMAELERERIAERTADGRARARASLEATGSTHKGQGSMGRPVESNPEEIKAWREANKASIAQVAEKFGVSDSTVKRACRG